MSERKPETPDAAWLTLTRQARAWFDGPHGQQLLGLERVVLSRELDRCFGSYLVHYAPCSVASLDASKIKRVVRLGAPLPGNEIACDEQAWPLSEHAADVVVLQHGLDFTHAPHALLREAARSVRPGGHLLIVGLNPWSLWGASRALTRETLRKAHCFSASRVGDWLNLLGFALENRRYGCYCPPLASGLWQARLAGLESLGQRMQAPTGGFYVLVARKLMVGLRPLRQERRQRVGKLIPLPVAKVSRRDPK